MTFSFGEWLASRRLGRVVETCMFGIRRDSYLPEANHQTEYTHITSLLSSEK